jgi:hypothetical protein
MTSVPPFASTGVPTLMSNFTSLSLLMCLLRFSVTETGVDAVDAVDAVNAFAFSNEDFSLLDGAFKILQI